MHLGGITIAQRNGDKEKQLVAKIIEAFDLLSIGPRFLQWAVAVGLSRRSDLKTFPADYGPGLFEFFLKASVVPDDGHAFIQYHYGQVRRVDDALAQM